MWMKLYQRVGTYACAIYTAQTLSGDYLATPDIQRAAASDLVHRTADSFILQVQTLELYTNQHKGILIMTSTIIDLFHTLDDLGDTFEVRVTPKASENRIKVDHQPDGTRLFRVYVTAVPENDKANKAVIALLAKALGVPKTALSIIKGHHTKHKTIQIQRGC